ncbi:ABC transporter permease subunit [Acrocarpospora pleiomorpha]|uniref:ABC transporter permease subunit n=1 Tax=Acrocarpospora pleiomorpha TaxID=90975 RepID=UPI0014783385|nr:ABC transporter permease subunit [Acrocarpospora pleiomorpha]
MTTTPTSPDADPSGPASRTAGGRRRRRRGWDLGGVPAVLVVTLVFVLPVAILCLRSVTEPTFGLENFTRLLGHSGYVDNIVRTILISAASTFVALIFGYPIAYQMVHGGTWLCTFLTVAIMAPYLTSILLRSFSWLVILGRQGPVNKLIEQFGLEPIAMVFTPIAVVVSLSHYLLPLMILPLAATMRSVDDSRMRAATSLGAGPAQAFVRVYLPLTKPGIQAGSVLCFVYGIGAFVIPALLGGSKGSMLGSLIHSAIKQSGDYGLASAAALVLGALVLVIVLVFQRLTGMSTTELAGRSGPTATRSAKRGGGRALRLAGRAAGGLDRLGVTRSRRLPKVLAAALGALVLAPQFIVIPISFASTQALIFPPVGYSTQWYAEFFTASWLDPLAVSVRVALFVTLIAGVLGTLAAMGVVRGTVRGWGASTSTLMMLPLLFPTVVAAAGFYVEFERIGLVDTELGIVLAHVTLALPFVFSVVSAGLRSLNPVYERAASSLGARRTVQLRRIVLPLIAPSILTAGLFAFLTSFDESTVAIFLSGVHVKTLPKRIFEALSLETNPTVAVISVFVMVCAAGIWLGYALFRRLTQTSRSNS